MQNRSKPQLTEPQRHRVDRAREVADASAQQIAGDYKYAQRNPEAYALGVTQATVKELLGIIAELTGEA